MMGDEAGTIVRMEHGPLLPSSGGIESWYRGSIGIREFKQVPQRDTGLSAFDGAEE
jgi:hypothetical protein